MGGQKINYKKGYRINFLEVIDKTNDRNTAGDILWKCYCHGCGSICLIPSNRLKKENKKSAYSCGCYHRGDLLPGEKYGELTVISKTKEKDRLGNTLYLFNCSCGKRNVKLPGTLVKNGNIKSCGHLKFPNYVGKKFGELTVLQKLKDRSSNEGVIYLCQCSCGKKIKVPIGDLKKGQLSCGHLRSSKGEVLISKILKNLNIDFEEQKTFQDCVNDKTKHKLKFDFYLPDYKCCIEYDGEQHFFTRNSGWNNKEHLKETKYRDIIKNNYCHANNIKLIRIPYWDFKCINEEYLQKSLSCPLMEF